MYLKFLLCCRPSFKVSASFLNGNVKFIHRIVPNICNKNVDCNIIALLKDKISIYNGILNNIDIISPNVMPIYTLVCRNLITLVNTKMGYQYYFCGQIIN